MQLVTTRAEVELTVTEVTTCYKYKVGKYLIKGNKIIIETNLRPLSICPYTFSVVQQRFIIEKR